jgi:hypothetical protein
MLFDISFMQSLEFIQSAVLFATRSKSSTPLPFKLLFPKSPTHGPAFHPWQCAMRGRITNQALSWFHTIAMRRMRLLRSSNIQVVSTIACLNDRDLVLWVAFL